MHSIRRHAILLPLLCSLSACGSGCSATRPDVPESVEDMPARYDYQRQIQQFGSGIAQAVGQQLHAMNDKVEKLGQGIVGLNNKIDTEIKGVMDKVNVALKRSGDLEVVVHQFQEMITGRVDGHEQRISSIEDKLKQEFVVPPPMPGETIEKEL